jgi:hypothetical protein
MFNSGTKRGFDMANKKISQPDPVQYQTKRKLYQIKLLNVHTSSYVTQRDFQETRNEKSPGSLGFHGLRGFFRPPLEEANRDEQRNEQPFRTTKKHLQMVRKGGLAPP